MVKTLHGQDPGMGKKEEKGWVQDDPMLLQRDLKWGFCIPLLAAQYDCEQLYLRAGECHADSRHCCALGVLPTPWSGFGKAADGMSSILSAEAGTLSSWARCIWWDPTIRAHIQLCAIGASCKDSPRRGVLCFRVGHHVTWFVSFCGCDGFAHISIVLCFAFAVVSKTVRIHKNRKDL